MSKVNGVAGEAIIKLICDFSVIVDRDINLIQAFEQYSYHIERIFAGYNSGAGSLVIYLYYIPARKCIRALQKGIRLWNNLQATKTT